VWQHVVYGCFVLADVRDTLLEVFGRGGEDYRGRMDGESALFALTVTDDGRLLLDSPVLFACEWATGRAMSRVRGGGRWLDGFEEDTKPWLARAAELGEPPVPGSGDAADDEPGPERLDCGAEESGSAACRYPADHREGPRGFRP
jgi:hypothetical protein